MGMYSILITKLKCNKIDNLTYIIIFLVPTSHPPTLVVVSFGERDHKKIMKVRETKNNWKKKKRSMK
jgi:hypothetical protein